MVSIFSLLQLIFVFLVSCHLAIFNLLLSGGFILFFGIFNINNNIICKHGQLHFFLPNLRAFYVLSLPHYTGPDSKPSGTQEVGADSVHCSWSSGETFGLSPLRVKSPVGFCICSLSIWGSFEFLILIKNRFEFC